MYKRQPVDCLRVRAPRLFNRGIGGSQGCYRARCSAVSYTHLDVYKRQSVWCPNPASCECIQTAVAPFQYCQSFPRCWCVSCWPVSCCCWLISSSANTFWILQRAVAASPHCYAFVSCYQQDRGYMHCLVGCEQSF